MKFWFTTKTLRHKEVATADYYGFFTTNDTKSTKVRKISGLQPVGALGGRSSQSELFQNAPPSITEACASVWDRLNEVWGKRRGTKKTIGSR